jgi:hypothetical protein
MLLATGQQLTQNWWNELQMPQDAITHVGKLGWCQKMPKTLTFADHFGFELPDVDDEVNDVHDSDYESNDDD